MNAPAKVQSDSLAAAMARAFAVKVQTRDSMDFIEAKRGASGVFWLPLQDDPFMFVSEDGEIVSLHKRPGRILRQSLSGEYLAVKVAGVTRHIHRIVCETFYGRRDGMHVRHLDGNQFNNRLANLAWGSPVENAADKARHGTDNRGERNSQAKLTRAKVDAMIADRKAGQTFKAIAARYGVAPMTAHRAIRGETWT